MSENSTPSPQNSFFMVRHVNDVLSSRKLAAIGYAVETQNSDLLFEELDSLHPADIADLIEQQNVYDRRRLLELMGEGFAGEILSELDENLREEVIRLLPEKVLENAFDDLASDDVVDLLEDLEEDQKEAILEGFDALDRQTFEESLTYPEGSAGRLMQREFIVAPHSWTVGATLEFLRQAEDLPRQFYHIILVDDDMRPMANVGLGRLLGTRAEAPMMSIQEDVFRTVPVEMDEGDIAYMFNQYHLITAPVTDELGKIVGMITIDDAMIVLDEQNEEDMLRLAGVAESSLSDRIRDTVAQRLPWLGVNLLTAILASLVIALFEETIAQLVALAVLMPIVASMGGNAGTQSMTVAVRALATRDLTPSNLWRVIRREIAVGLISGLVLAAVMGAVSALWFSTPMLGAVIACAMVINLVVAGFAGVALPVILEKMGVDPALASGVFVTTITDIVGFFTFLGLAGVYLL